MKMSNLSRKSARDIRIINFNLLYYENGFYQEIENDSKSYCSLVR